MQVKSRKVSAYPSAITATLVLGIGVLPAPSQAQESAARLDFELPAQDLKSALRAVAARFGHNIILSEDDVRGRTGPPLHGTYSESGAYSALLNGTALVADLSDRGMVVIRPQQPAAPTPPAAGQSATSPETVVVTGRAGVESRTRAETSYSISIVPQERLRQIEAGSVADSIRSIPGFWVEDSSGEASANVRARGIPVDGYASIQLAEDGVPIQHDPALGYLNADQSFRLDETISQIQVVRGGPSSIFSSNAPGGLVNYITRKPGPETQGLLKLTFGDDGLYRTDLWIGGPVGNGWRAALGGFHRTERGVRYPGYSLNHGGQFRVSAGHEVGNGTLDFDYKHIDDDVGFYSDIPLQLHGNSVSSVPRLNASTGILNGPETESLRVRTITGQSIFDTRDGTLVTLDQATLNLVQNCGGWHVEDHVRFRATHQERMGLFPVSVQTGTLRLSQLLPTVQALFPTAASLQFRYVDSPNSVFSPTQNGNGLETDDAARRVAINEHELLNDLRFSRKFDIAGQSHDLSVGVYALSAQETFVRYSAIALIDVETHARLLNLVALNSAGAVIGTATENGIIRYGAEFADGQGDQQTRALYAADEWQLNDELRIDLGARAESMTTTGSSEGTTTVNLGQTHTLADKSYLTGNGVFTPYDRTFSTVTWSVGANLQFDAAHGLFTRVTGAARLPSISDFITSPDSAPVIDRTQMYELGYKLSRPLIDAYVTLFDTEYHDYGVTETVYDTATQKITTQNYYGNTRDYGIELDGALRPAERLAVVFSATIQEPQYTSLQYTVQSGSSLVTVDYSGNQLLRIPKVSVNLSPTVTLYHDVIRAELSVAYYSDRYADAANSQKLPAYTVLSANARCRLAPGLTLYLSGSNLTNTLGLTEGNPRSGEVLSSLAGDPVFLGRPIPGRNVKMSFLYTF